MPKDYLMPKLAMAMNEGTINEWLVENGDFVRAGELVVVVETEKVSYELESPETGHLRILVGKGETVPVGTLIGRFLESRAETSDSIEALAMPAAGEGHTGGDRGERAAEAAEGASDRGVARTSRPERINASPVVRKLAREAGIDLATIQGTGPGGRIVKQDIEAALETVDASRAAAPEPDVGQAAGGPRELVRYGIKGTLRGTIARRMLASVQSSAQLSSNWESDLTKLETMRRGYVEREEELGTRISMNAFLIKAIVYAVRQLPLANAALIGDEVVIYDDINLGIAVAIPGMNEYETSLVAPVLKCVQNLDVVEIDRRMKALIAGAREKTLGADDMSGSTITFSSTAGIAPPGSQNTPILNMPNTVIVGTSTPAEKVVVRDGEMVIRRMLPMSVSFDHRILDGEPAARFMSALHEAIEEPALMPL